MSFDIPVLSLCALLPVHFWREQKTWHGTVIDAHGMALLVDSRPIQSRSNAQWQLLLTVEKAVFFSELNLTQERSLALAILCAMVSAEA